MDLTGPASPPGNVDGAAKPKPRVNNYPCLTVVPKSTKTIPNASVKRAELGNCAFELLTEKKHVLAYFLLSFPACVTVFVLNPAEAGL